MITSKNRPTISTFCMISGGVIKDKDKDSESVNRT